MYEKSTFVNQLRALRENSGITQKEISVKLDTTEATISRYFSGDRTPTIETAVELASIFNVSMDTLCGIESPAKGQPSQEIRILMDCYSRASAEDRKVLWSFLNRYMTPNQKAVINAVAMAESKDAVV